MFEVPFIPDRAPFSIVKFFKGFFNFGKVAKGGKYAFGLKNEVVVFANEIGASHLMKDPNWKSSFLNIINNSKNELHFTLNGIDEARCK